MTNELEQKICDLEKEIAELKESRQTWISIANKYENEGIEANKKLDLVKQLINRII